MRIPTNAVLSLEDAIESERHFDARGQPVVITPSGIMGRAQQQQ